MHPLVFYARLAQLSYRDDSVIQEEISKYEIEHYKLVTIGSAQCCIFYYKNKIVIGVKGSNNLENLWLDTKQHLVDFKINTTFFGKVHQGFMEYIDILRDTINKEIDDFVKAHKLSAKRSHGSSILHIGNINVNESKRITIDKLTKDDDAFGIIFTGHSLGASCAFLAMECKHKYYDTNFEISCFTFGSPKLGDVTFIQNYKKLNINHFNIIYLTDLVTVFPAFKEYEQLPGRVTVFDQYAFPIMNTNNCMCTIFLLFSCRKKNNSLESHHLDRYIESLTQVFKSEDVIARIVTMKSKHLETSCLSKASCFFDCKAAKRKKKDLGKVGE